MGRIPATIDRRKLLAALGIAASPLLLNACGGGGASSGGGNSSSSSASTSPVAPAVTDATLLDIHRRAFNLFWDRGGTVLGLMPDRTPTPSAASIASVGFALTANCIGAMNAYV